MVESSEFASIFAFRKVEAFNFLAEDVEKFLDVEGCDFVVGAEGVDLEIEY